MKAKIIGAVAGALIVTLALTAGRQYATAAQSGKAYDACFADQQKTSALFNTAVNSYLKLREITVSQEQLIEQLRAQQVQLELQIQMLEAGR